MPRWLESAGAFVRSARLRDGSARFSGRAPHACGSGGRAADTRGDAAGHGGRHGSSPYAGSVDDSEVDPDRPIKCCDAIHSISHYPPRCATAGERVPRMRRRMREILMTGR
ncbi:hypothetical protein DIE17_16480 [Burkholderia sp. Bp9099]|nr:hypothetical protein DIE17_16480 [Burkholderia sp. Bp9099]